MDREQVALDYLENTTPSLTALAQSIWDHPEIGLMENHAAGLIAGELERNGFSVTREAAGLPTAFIASWGTGGPTIGILGEYDALPGLSQKVAPIREPAEAGAPGHACGHNLLGTASMGYGTVSDSGDNSIPRLPCGGDTDRESLYGARRRIRRH